MKRVKLIVHGKVQGVFFRVSTVDFASKTNLKGYAKNLSDGSVEVVAEGSEEEINALIKYCHNGPEGAAVHKVDVSYETVQNEFDDFSVQY